MGFAEVLSLLFSALELCWGVILAVGLRLVAFAGDSGAGVHDEGGGWGIVCGWCAGGVAESAVGEGESGALFLALCCWLGLEFSGVV